MTLEEIYTQGKLSIGQHYAMRMETNISVYQILEINDDSIGIECVIDTLYPEDIGEKFQFLIRDAFEDILIEVQLDEIKAKYL